MNLPIPKHIAFHVGERDFGHKKGMAIQYKCGDCIIRNAVEGIAFDFDYNTYRQSLLRWFWRKLGAA